VKPIQFLLAKITEAYCVENNIPIKRQFTHEELEASIEQIRHADKLLYGQPPAAEPCTDLPENELRPAVLKPEGDLEEPG